MVSFRFLTKKQRLLYISSYQRKQRTPTCDNCYHDCYQSHHSHFDYGTDSIFSKIHVEGRFRTQLEYSIYDDHHYLYRILRPHRCLQYPIYRSTWSGKSHIIYLHGKFGSCECKHNYNRYSTTGNLCC